MKRFFLALLAALALSGCMSLDSPINGDYGDYQPGDGLNRILDARTEYCATADPETRAVALGILGMASGESLGDGVCTDIVAAIGDRNVEDLTNADYEAAREAQRRAQERMNAVSD